jgi:hypothetical protein
VRNSDSNRVIIALFLLCLFTFHHASAKDRLSVDSTAVCVDTTDYIEGQAIWIRYAVLNSEPIEDAWTGDRGFNCVEIASISGKPVSQLVVFSRSGHSGESDTMFSGERNFNGEFRTPSTDSDDDYPHLKPDTYEVWFGCEKISEKIVIVVREVPDSRLQDYEKYKTLKMWQHHENYDFDDPRAILDSVVFIADYFYSKVPGYCFRKEALSAAQSILNVHRILWSDNKLLPAKWMNYRREFYSDTRSCMASMTGKNSPGDDDIDMTAAGQNCTYKRNAVREEPSSP